MDPPRGCRPLRPCLLHHPHHHLHHHLHHHRHHHPLFLNPHHPHHHFHRHHRHHHHHLRPSFPQNPEQQPTPIPPPTNETSGLKAAYDHNPTLQVLQEQNHDGVEFEEEEEEEDDDPIFVLTDEWKEFFAKSEAKRKLERKQAKKGKK